MVSMPCGDPFAGRIVCSQVGPLVIGNAPADAEGHVTGSGLYQADTNQRLPRVFKARACLAGTV